MNFEALSDNGWDRNRTPEPRKSIILSNEKIVKLHCQEYTNIRTNIDTQINLAINLDYLTDHRNSIIIHLYHDYVSMTQKKEMSTRNNNYKEVLTSHVRELTVTEDINKDI